jgi:hypothetical protein
MTTHDPKLLHELEEERADRFATRLTLQQLEAIAKDIRLPGEVAGAYGVSAAVIVRIQQKARFSKNQKAAAARRKRLVSGTALVGMLLLLWSEAIA